MLTFYQRVVELGAPCGEVVVHAKDILFGQVNVCLS